uniref:Ranatuerin-2LTa n=1 Tax=Rana latastei TaxID=151453 RepID=RN2A_RANLT|nr:RecName: Full=Ranatuerin-2LTa [Rana latastei]
GLMDALKGAAKNLFASALDKLKCKVTGC